MIMIKESDLEDIVNLIDNMSNLSVEEILRRANEIMERIEEARKGYPGETSTS